MKVHNLAITFAVTAGLWACKSEDAPSRSTTNSFASKATKEKVENGEVSKAGMETQNTEAKPNPSDTSLPSQSSELPQAPSPTTTPAGNSGGNSTDIPSDPNTARAVGNFPAVSIKLNGMPTGKSDLYNYTGTIEADAAISHYAFKIDTPENCSKGNGYKVESVKTPLPVAIGARADGAVAVCILGYYFPTKQWLAPAEAKVFAWEKIAFNRTISAAYEEFDDFCGKTILTNTEIEIKGDVAVYVWSRDAQAQGCDEPLDQGKDVMTIQSNDQKEIRGFWAFGGGGASGWFHFTWTNADRIAFKGTYGYGEPDLKSEGAWNSK